MSDSGKDIHNRVYGLALSGGGARGFAHIGVLKALDELGIKPAVISGVSAGSVAACMYASGMKFEDSMKAFSNKSFSDLTELSVPKDGFFKLDRFRAFLRKYIPVKNLEDLEIPTYIGATDLDHCKYEVFDHGPIDECIAASCSIPIIFRPMKINGTLYVDGGVLKNLPASIIRNKCDTLIGVNVSPMVNEKLKPSIIEIALRSYKLMSKTNTIADINMCDILIESQDIASHHVFNIKSMWEIAEIGYKEALKAIENYKSTNI